MKLGMSSLLEHDSVEDNIRLAKNLDLDFIELNYNFNYCRMAILDGKISQLLKDNNLEATIHFFDEADFGAIDEIRDTYIKLFSQIIQVIENINEIKSIIIHLNPGPIVTINGKKHYVYEKEEADFKTRLYDSLETLNDLCLKNNKQIIIENTVLPNFLKKVYLELKQKDYYFCYDIGHDYKDKYKINILQQSHDFNFKEFHIHNSDGFKDHLALNKGLININYFKTMALVHDAMVVIEVKNESDLKLSVPLFKSI